MRSMNRLSGAGAWLTRIVVVGLVCLFVDACAETAMFSGVLKGQTLTLSVTPSDPSLRPASYVLQLTNGTGKCAVPCV
jgi:hypothetical protein